MARRVKSSLNPLWIVGVVLLLLLAFGGAHFFISNTSTPYRTAAALDVQSYLDNANSLRGNVYRLEGEVLNSLAWSPSSGRLISVGVDGSKAVVPVLVTTQFNNLNIQKGQKFIFLLEVDDMGILKTKSLTKS